ncbi:hypothetical protein ACHAW5_001585 [Stephanodiscus triporus]|uniref:Uncharacterized protein n=1 Tax=Stephanodiscus triporus TaxID=2934178 RepID=A0ABD3NLU3_9STRA
MMHKGRMQKSKDGFHGMQCISQRIKYYCPGHQKAPKLQTLENASYVEMKRHISQTGLSNIHIHPSESSTLPHTPA